MAGTPGIKKRTRRAVYEYVREQGMVTKNDIAIALGISLPTVNKYVTHFLEAGLLEQGAKLASGSSGGRNPIAYTCVADGRYAIGVDITRDRVRCLVLNLKRQVIATRRTRREFEPSASYFEFVGREIDQLIEGAVIDRGRVLGVGVAVPGLISETTGQVTYGRVIDNLGLSAADFGHYIPFDVRLVHDSEAAGFAEFWSNKTVENAFYISLSKSVGGSVLVKNELYRGDGELAGEIGHMRIHSNGLRCYCGQHGCLDPYCNSDVLSEHTDGSVEAFFEKLAAGDEILAGVWDRYTSDLAIAVHNIRVLFGCSIILGGDVGAHCAAHIADLRAKVERLSFLEKSSASYLVPCTYTTYPIATGAALYLVDEFRQDLGAVQPGPGQPTGQAPSAADHTPEATHTH